MPSSRPLKLLGSLAVTLALTACNQPAAPAPTAVDGNASAVERPRRPTPKPGSRLQPPEGRFNDELTASELEDALAAADAAHAEGNVAQEIIALRRCGNKTPGSVRCDTRLGALLVLQRHTKPEGRYYLDAALALESSDGDAATYVLLGDSLRAHGAYDNAAIAHRRALALAENLDTLLALARTLQMIDGGQIEAAELLNKAVLIDPTRTDLMFERSVLLGQVSGHFLEAADAMSAWLELERSNLAPEKVATIEGRIAQLRLWGEVEARGEVLAVEGMELTPTADGKYKTFKKVQPGQPSQPGQPGQPGRLPEDEGASAEQPPSPSQ